MNDVVVPIKPPKKPKRFEAGHTKVGGRKKGSINKVPKLLKDAVILAAELEGYDGKGQDQMVGFLRRVIRDDFHGFVGLLARSMLNQETRASSNDVSVEVTYRSVDEVRRELASRGIDMEVVTRILHRPANVIDPSGEMVDDFDDEED
jgi:hypothetical protein